MGADSGPLTREETVCDGWIMTMLMDRFSCAVLQVNKAAGVVGLSSMLSACSLCVCVCVCVCVFVSVATKKTNKHNNNRNRVQSSFINSLGDFL